jgi:L-lysine 6-monooxygenase (NADPH-requiring)
LWINGCSFLIEMFDYTFDEHFHGEPATVYMKRQDLLEYMIGRVTKHCPYFFERYFKFNSEVVNVTFDDQTQKFVIRINDLVSGETCTNEFDKCIWACGGFGIPKVPKQMVAMFRDGGFQGRIIHSSETTTLEDDVKGKRVLIIGGGYSAEDITLQAIKLGVDHVYISSRLRNNTITWTTKWPFDKVTTFLEQEPMAMSGKNSIQFREIWWEYHGYMRYNEKKVSNEIHNIDTIIFCTGYDPLLHMIDDKLKPGNPGGEEYFSSKYMFDAPKDWTMHNGLLTDYTGDVPLNSTLRYPTWRVHPEFYRGILISNPNMMYISTYNSEYPLLTIDVQVHLLARYMTGLKEFPSVDEMRSSNLEDAIDMLQFPYIRYLIDESYYNVVTNLPNFWPEGTYDYPEVWWKVCYEYYIMDMKNLAWMMEEASYPLRTGTRYELNETAKTMMQFDLLCYYHRYNLKCDAATWKTFRDYTDGDQFYSLFTNKKAGPMKHRWLDTDHHPMTNNHNYNKTDENDDNVATDTKQTMKNDIDRTKIRNHTTTRTESMKSNMYINLLEKYMDNSSSSIDKNVIVA